MLTILEQIAFGLASLILIIGIIGTFIHWPLTGCVVAVLVVSYILGDCWKTKE